MGIGRVKDFYFDDSGWTECAPVVVRSRELIVEPLERLRQTMPFPLISLDTDNGVEFVNEVLVNYCAKHGIGLIRSRPYAPFGPSFRDSIFKSSTRHA